MAWTRVSTGHEVSLSNGKVVARSKDGKAMRSVPATLKDDPVVVGLRQLADWLRGHDAACLAEVEQWMVRSLPVPLAVIVELWPDPSWQRALRDLIVQSPDEAEVGLLRAADRERGAGFVTLDGETVWLTDPTLLIPHPVRLPDLAELREFVVDLGAEQGVPQLFRETYSRPLDADPGSTQVDDWAGAAFAQLRHVTSRVTSSGYGLRGGCAVLKVYEGGRRLEARVWVGDGAPDAEAETGSLVWVDEHNTAVPLGAVGPVAWSEGARMAARIHAGRVVDADLA